MDANAARMKLLAQHDQLRANLGQCTALARRLRDGEPVDVELDAALAQLRQDFAKHNESETELVRQLLRDSSKGRLLVDRMFEEHIGEHAVFWELLVGSADEVASRIDHIVEQLDAHMAAEERTFLSPVALRQDVLTPHD